MKRILPLFEPQTSKTSNHDFAIRSDINSCVSVLVLSQNRKTARKGKYQGSNAKEFVICQWSFVITMAIDNWQMIIDKFFLLGIMPCATIYGAVHRRAL
jgi:hypothetical protein